MKRVKRDEQTVAGSFRGTPGDDRLIGTNGQDFFDPGLGHDVVDGGGSPYDYLKIDYSSIRAGATLSEVVWSKPLGSFVGTFDGGRSASCDFRSVEYAGGFLTKGADTLRVILASPDIPVLNIDAGAGRDTLEISYRGSEGRLFNFFRPEYAASLGGLQSSVSNFGGFERFVISFGNGDDELHGGWGNDVLSGGGGDDLIHGNRGADTLTGGLGADTFVFDSKQEMLRSFGDTITDFNRYQGDKIDLSRIDPGTARGDQAFTFIGEARFSHVEGQAQLRFSETGAGVYRVEGDWNGDLVADFAITVHSVADLVRSDFVL